MASTTSSQPQQISIADLEQLYNLRRQLEEELNHLTNSFAWLRQAQTKFKSCTENVGEVTPQNKGMSILVPLTNFSCVPGHLSDTENVTVDFGASHQRLNLRVEAARSNSMKCRNCLAFLLT
ncbi:hypothetical protein BD769DRAFT_1583812 [Suillus cothurnatus]|nr:hypothetical protein BD769DRAFT_1583812 [Suillus cothurnatus]